MSRRTLAGDMANLREAVHYFLAVAWAKMRGGRPHDTLLADLITALVVILMVAMLGFIANLYLFR